MSILGSESGKKGKEKKGEKNWHEMRHVEG